MKSMNRSWMPSFVCLWMLLISSHNGTNVLPHKHIYLFLQTLGIARRLIALMMKNRFAPCQYAFYRAVDDPVQTREYYHPIRALPMATLVTFKKQSPRLRGFPVFEGVGVSTSISLYISSLSPFQLDRLLGGMAAAGFVREDTQFVL